MAKYPANLASPVLLEKIDKFFELGIGEYVALPQVRHTSAILLQGLLWQLNTVQLLVVGDQSRYFASKERFGPFVDGFQWEELSARGFDWPSLST